MEVDLRHSIAEGYKHSPDLRLAWLKELAELHAKDKRHAEAAQCYLHMVALIAEYKYEVEVKAYLPQGCAAFAEISPNVVEESATSNEHGKAGDEVSVMRLALSHACAWTSSLACFSVVCLCLVCLLSTSSVLSCAYRVLGGL